MQTQPVSAEKGRRSPLTRLNSSEPTGPSGRIQNNRQQTPRARSKQQDGLERSITHLVRLVRSILDSASPTRDGKPQCIKKLLLNLLLSGRVDSSHSDAEETDWPPRCSLRSTLRRVVAERSDPVLQLPPNEHAPRAAGPGQSLHPQKARPNSRRGPADTLPRLASSTCGALNPLMRGPAGSIAPPPSDPWLPKAWRRAALRAAGRAIRYDQPNAVINE
jgi:hypothetical protein